MTDGHEMSDGDWRDFSLGALVPEQLVHYVRGMSGMRPLRVGSCLGWRQDDRLVLTAFPLTEPPFGPAERQSIEEAAVLAASLPWVRHLVMLAPFRPRCAPPSAHCHEDACWSVPLPVPTPGGKLGNQIRRALREIRIDQHGGEGWTGEHEDLVLEAGRRLQSQPGERALSGASALLFTRIGHYLRVAGPAARCYSARRLSDGSLCALAVADHAAYATAFYLFAFRSSDAPPGTADALLLALLEEAARRGQRRCNLGLGIHDGIRFFKRKWQAEPWLPYVECAWDIAAPSRPSLLARLLTRLRGDRQEA